MATKILQLGSIGEKVSFDKLSASIRADAERISRGYMGKYMRILRKTQHHMSTKGVTIEFGHERIGEYLGH